jgi:hypothetical protein
MSDVECTAWPSHRQGSRSDIQEVAQRALGQAREIVEHWLPDGHLEGAEWVALNPRRDDQTEGSFKVNLSKGCWSDFALPDARGGDLVALVAYLDQSNQGEAARRLDAWLGRRAANDPPAPRTSQREAPPLQPIPDAALRVRPAAHPSLGAPSAAWTYRDAAGRPLFLFCRFGKPDGGKRFAPLTWDGRAWRWEGPPAPRPLYHLDQMATQPDAPILVCEGEKSADAAAKLLPDCVTTTSLNGAQSPKHADWSPLAGRLVRIWPDADEPGARYAQEVATLAGTAGARAVEILDLSSIRDDLPKGWDAADAAEEWALLGAAPSLRWVAVQAPAAAQEPTTDPDRRRYIGPPKPTPSMFYGPLGEWSAAATANSEANRAAVFITLAAYVGAALGRERFTWIDNSRHHPRIFTLHVGRTARGRKGTAAAPTLRLHETVKQMDIAQRELGDGEVGLPAYAPGIHTGGLSTREGICYKLRDPTATDAGQPDKRLWVLESEFSNTLNQNHREGNNLSSGLRECYDGTDLGPLARTNTTHASNPHVVLCGHVTPSELLMTLDDVSIANGFLNRFIIFWGERSRRVAFPSRIPDDLLVQWAGVVCKAIDHARMHPGEVEMTPEAKETYQETYLNEWDDYSGGPVVVSLMERAAANAIRLALILACLDRRDEIGREHLECGIAWTRYWRSSVTYIWRDRENLAEVDERASKRHQNAMTIADLVRSHGEVSRTALLRAGFKGHIKSQEIDEALEYGETQTPPWFVVEEVVTKTTPSRTYRKTMVRLPDTGPDKAPV